MSRPRSANRDEAYEIWIASNKKIPIKDIALRLSVSEAQVRNWKRMDDWVKLAKQKKQHVVTKPRGAPKGNNNAEGHGAPIGSHNALKHGAYERFVAMHMLSDEAEVADDIEINDVAEELKITLAFLKAKELRLMKRIEALRSLNEHNMMVSAVTRTKSEKLSGVFIEDEDGHLIKQNGTGFFDGERENTTVTSTSSTGDALNKLEAELDKVQSKKLKVLAQLDKYQLDRERLEIERLRARGESETSSLAADWVAGLMELDNTQNGNDESIE